GIVITMVGTTYLLSLASTGTQDKLDAHNISNRNMYPFNNSFKNETCNGTYSSQIPYIPLSDLVLVPVFMLLVNVLIAGGGYVGNLIYNSKSSEEYVPLISSIE